MAPPLEAGRGEEGHALHGPEGAVVVAKHTIFVHVAPRVVQKVHAGRQAARAESLQEPLLRVEVPALGLGPVAVDDVGVVLANVFDALREALQAEHARELVLVGLRQLVAEDELHMVVVGGEVGHDGVLAALQRAPPLTAQLPLLLLRQPQQQVRVEVNLPPATQQRVSHGSPTSQAPAFLRSH